MDSDSELELKVVERTGSLESPAESIDDDDDGRLTGDRSVLIEEEGLDAEGVMIGVLEDSLVFDSDDDDDEATEAFDLVPEFMAELQQSQADLSPPVLQPTTALPSLDGDVDALLPNTADFPSQNEVGNSTADETGTAAPGAVSEVPVAQRVSSAGEVPVGRRPSIHGVAPPPLPTGGTESPGQGGSLSLSGSWLPGSGPNDEATARLARRPFLEPDYDVDIDDILPTDLPSELSGEAGAEILPLRPPAPVALPAVSYAETPDESEDGLENEATSVYASISRSELPRSRLLVVAGDEVGKTFYLNRAECTAGRGTDNDIVLPDIAVSRRHVRLVRHPEGFRIVDLESGNGSYVNGRRVTEAELYDGDRIEIGNTLLDFAMVGKRRNRQVGALSDGTDPGIPTPAIRHRGRTKRSRTRAVVGTAVLLLVGFLTNMFVIKMVTSRGEEVEGPAKKKARAYFERAEAAIRQRAWDDASEDINLARELAADLFDYDAWVVRIDRGKRHRDRIEEAKRLVSNVDAKSVATLLEEIGPDSAYHADAEDLVELAQREVSNRRASQAKRLMADGRTAEALVIAEEVLENDSAHAMARGVIKAIQASVEDGTSANELVEGDPLRSMADRKVRQAIAEGLRQYRSQAFEEAAIAFQRALRHRPSAIWRERAQTRLKAIRSFINEWSIAARADRARRTIEAITARRRALKIDAQLGGFLRRDIERKLAQGYYRRAVEAFEARNFRDSIAYNRQVLRLSPAHSLGRELAQKIRGQAAGLLKQAEQAMSGDSARAVRLARMALAISEENEEVYRRAYQLLQRESH